MPKGRISKVFSKSHSRCANCGGAKNPNDNLCLNLKCNDVGKRANWDKVVAGLGKATMRGVKRCPKCGTMNGCKGNVCKNKECNTLLKDSSSPKKLSETCKLDTGTFTKVYSVRVRDKGPECRGFVQLPLDAETDIIQNSALCFVDHCQGNFKTKERSGNERAVTCNHIDAALKCVTNAIPLRVNRDNAAEALDAMSIQPHVKKEFWSLIMESSGPAVQRVSRDAMAVKCRVSTKFPLGYLHTTFVAGRTDHDLQFSCPCPAFRETAQGVPSKGRCVHFYACICAFLNQETLRDEFAAYIRLEVSVGLQDQPNLRKEPEVDFSSLIDCCHVEILQDSMSAILSDVGATDGTILSDACVLTSADLSETDHPVSSILTESLSSDAIVFATEDTQEELGRASLDTLTFPGIGKVSDSIILGSQNETDQDVGLTHLVPLFMETVLSDQIPSTQTRTKKKQGTIRPQLTFLEWLGSVTEMINQHMHYQFTGQAVIIIQAPSKFFDKLKERMYRSRRKRLSSKMIVFNRTDSVPFGTFIKHSWTLTSRFHVKAVFDTPQMPLKLVRSFTQNNHAGFDAIDEGNCALLDGSPLFKTYLRVGLHKGETEPVPFQIEWIPDLLPVSRIGELRIEFEFGHIPCLLSETT